MKPTKNRKGKNGSSRAVNPRTPRSHPKSKTKNPKSRIASDLFQRGTCAAVVAFSRLLHLLPADVVFQLGRLLGGFAFLLLPKYRAIASANLEIAFGNSITPTERNRIARESFLRLGGNFLSGARLADASDSEIDARVTVENVGAMDAGPEKTPIVIALLHTGNWELLAHLQQKLGLVGRRTGIVFQPLENRYLDAFVRQNRERRGFGTIDRSQGFQAAVEYLRDGGVVPMLVDQHAGDAGLWTPFLGRIASTTTLPALLARRTGARLLLAMMQTTGTAKWHLSFRVLDSAGSVEAITARINAAASEAITNSPADWFWVHRRWKTPSPKFLLTQYKRGIYTPPDSPLKPFRIVIRSPNWLGDAVISSPAVRAIKMGRPDAQVAILTPEKLQDFWAAIPWVDEVIPFKQGALPLSVAGKIRGRFDVGILFPNSPRSAIELFLAGIPRRVGYARGFRKIFLNQIIPVPKKPDRPKHQSHHYLDIAEHVGAKREDALFGLPPEPPESPGRIGLCPGAEYGPAKRWFPARFATVVRILSERRNLNWSIFGTAKDVPVAEEITKLCGVAVDNRCGKTSLADLIRELRRCRLLITNDTGTMHLAAFLGVPVLAIFGSTEPGLTGPMGEGHAIMRHKVECSPCFLRECPLDFRCMKGIAPDDVVETAIRLLEAPPE